MKDDKSPMIEALEAAGEWQAKAEAAERRLARVRRVVDGMFGIYPFHIVKQLRDALDRHVESV